MVDLMNFCKINEILEQHKIWLCSGGKNGVKADLRYANLNRADLKGANLNFADLSDANLESTDLRDANLNCADLSDANLGEAFLTDARLSYVSLRNANLHDVDLRRADLRHADLRGADLRYADLSGANLHSAYPMEANLSEADLRGADLSDADLTGVNLRGADLRDANLAGANLRGADLRDADLKNVDLPESTFIISGEEYFISISGDYVRAGCQAHSVSKWRQFNKQDILEMDGKKLLKFYPRLLDLIDFYYGQDVNTLNGGKIDNKTIIERLLRGNWFTACKTAQEVDLILQSCENAGIKWVTHEKATEFKPYGQYPIYIFNEYDDHTLHYYSSINGKKYSKEEYELAAEYHEKRGYEDITDWYFNKIKNK